MAKKADKKFAFLVCEIGWEYNDEYYYRPESRGVTPKRLFLKAEDALAECRRLNSSDDSGMETSEGETCQQYEVVEVELG